MGSQPLPSFAFAGKTYDVVDRLARELGLTLGNACHKQS